MIRLAEEQMEQKVYRIWSVLSAFEESSAACISDMLLHVSNGAYIEGVFVAEKFIWHVELLFGRTDNLDIRLSNVAPKGMHTSFIDWEGLCSVLMLTIIRPVVLSRSKIALQEDCSFLQFAVENSGNWCSKAWCHTRVAFFSNRSCALS